MAQVVRGSEARPRSPRDPLSKRQSRGTHIASARPACAAAIEHGDEEQTLVGTIKLVADSMCTIDEERFWIDSDCYRLFHASGGHIMANPYEGALILSHLATDALGAFQTSRIAWSVCAIVAIRRCGALKVTVMKTSHCCGRCTTPEKATIETRVPTRCASTGGRATARGSRRTRRDTGRPRRSPTSSA